MVGKTITERSCNSTLARQFYQQNKLGPVFGDAFYFLGLHPGFHAQGEKPGPYGTLLGRSSIFNLVLLIKLAGQRTVAGSFCNCFANHLLITPFSYS